MANAAGLVATFGSLLVLTVKINGTIRGRCWIKCGVIDEERGDKNLQSFVSSVWDDLRFSKSLTSIDIQFERIQRRDEMTMEDLIKAYMEIGTVNVSALIGSYTQVSATATHKFGIPYFVTDVDPGSVHFAPYNVISVRPNGSDRQSIAVELVRRYQWKTVGLLYEEGEGGIQLIESLVRLPSVQLKAWKIDADVATRQVLMQLRHLAVANIVVMATQAVIDDILETALSLSMMSKRYTWIIPSLSISESTLKRYAYSQVNLTTLQLTQSHTPNNDFTTALFSKSEYAAVYDSLLTLFHGVKIHFRNNRSCHWMGKENIPAALSMIEDSGATGMLSFRADGTRKGYIVNVLSLQPEGLVQIGFWNSSEDQISDRLYLNQSAIHELSGAKDTFARWHIKVVAILEEPYVIASSPVDRGSPKDKHVGGSRGRFSGFSVDLLAALAERVGFTYEIYLAPDGQRGQRLSNGSWTGMMGEIINENALLAIGPLVVTSSREEVIDFTKAFDLASLTILAARRHRNGEASIVTFFFFRPFSWIVWALLVGTFVSVSLVLYALDKCFGDVITSITDPRHERLSLIDCFWSTYSSMVLMATAQQTAPRSMAGRLLNGSLWWFSLIIVISYTANMAAMLATWNGKDHVTTAASAAAAADDELLQRLVTTEQKIKYVTSYNGDAGALLLENVNTLSSLSLERTPENVALVNIRKYYQSFRSSNSLGKSDPAWTFVGQIEDGLKRVRNPTGSDQLAFIHETSSLHHFLFKHPEAYCDLDSVTLQVQGVGYAIGVARGSLLTAKLNSAISGLLADGSIQSLKAKWFSNISCLRPHDDETAAAATADASFSLSTHELSGLFALLALAIVTSILVGAVERRFRSKRKPTGNNKSASHKSLVNNSAKTVVQSESSAFVDVLHLEQFTEPNPVIIETMKQNASSHSRETIF